MKILVDARSLGEKPSGIGMYLYNFILFLYKEEEEVFLLTDIDGSKEIKTLCELGIPVIKYNKKCNKSIYILNYFRFIQKQIHAIKPEIFWEGNNIIPLALKNPYGKIYVTIHDIFPLTKKAYYSYFYRFYFKFFIKKTIKITDAILYNSKETKESVENYFPITKEKNNFISYIIIESKFKFNIKDNGYFLYVGNCEKRKGTDILLEAYKIYIENGGDKALYLIGNIREKYIQQMVDNMNYISKFKYIGYVSEEEKERYLSECSCFVFPSIAEGFGIPILEALHYKKPVIASNLPVFKEIVGEAINYFDIATSYNNQIKNLVDKLFSYENQEIPQNILSKYEAKNLGKQLKLYLNREQ